MLTEVRVENITHYRMVSDLRRVLPSHDCLGKPYSAKSADDGSLVLNALPPIRVDRFS
jgi:hypothetical protein